MTGYIKIIVLKKILLTSLLIYKQESFMNNMNRTIGVIPAQCKKCGELFDLSYDLEGVSNERLVFELMRGVRNPRVLMCWECRSGI